MTPKPDEGKLQIQIRQLVSDIGYKPVFLLARSARIKSSRGARWLSALHCEPTGRLRGIDDHHPGEVGRLGEL